MLERTLECLHQEELDELFCEMESEIHDYWRQRLEETCGARDEMVEQLREEVSRLQQRCSELSSINAMGRASVGYDIMNFVTDSASTLQDGTPVIPIEVLNEYLHHYTNGLVPFERTTKRQRCAMQLGHNLDINPAASALGVRRVTKTMIPASIAPQLRAHQAPAESHVQISTAAEADAVSIQDEPECMDVVSHKESAQTAGSALPCQLQHRRNLAVEQHAKRDRGAPMDDELTQLRPWLFSRVP